MLRLTGRREVPSQGEGEELESSSCQQQEKLRESRGGHQGHYLLGRKTLRQVVSESRP